MSHHFDTDQAKADPRLNICDLYVFKGGGERTVLAMTCCADAGISSPDLFHPEGTYAFRIDLNGESIMRGHKSLRGLHTDSQLLAKRARQCGQLAILCGVLALGSIEIASAKDFTLLLTGDEEVPSVTTEASATGVISVADDHSISGTIHTTGIDGTVARIYVQSPGRNGGAIVTLQWIDDNTWTVPLGSRLTEVQYNYYKFGLLYVNIQSAAYATGEIRAQIQP